ncbi:hypothetical protein OsccyDRAFT_3883 [Leptolyngbyaceae cyanobacterium JSC-12]|nr:hypothetical protein OsccyDRAFT_3883 [Leptolyngbyaceae cyanobacterium JSC-12]
MSSGLILILAVLVLGGVIATVGDRIGTKVGKSRLSLFNLRPRKTATLVTILTGVVVAASTLGILLGTSGPLRTGIFEYERIQRDRRRAKADLQAAREELQAARNERSQIGKELNKARSDQTTAQKQLAETNESLKSAVVERDKANALRSQVQSELSQAQTELAQNEARLVLVTNQTATLRAEINQLQAERQRVIAQGEEEIRAKNAVIQEREQRLKLLEAQQEFLVREIAKLEREAEGLRRGNVAIQRGQVLSSAVVRIVNPAAAQDAVDRLLREANRVAMQLARPGSRQQEQVILITKAEVGQLTAQIDDGRDYVVRVLSAANYLVGETPIQVVVEAVPNQVIFNKGDLVASTLIDPSVATDAEIQQRINLLLAAANFRARRLGILTDTVEIGRVQNLLTFIERVKEYKQAVELRAIAASPTYTAGPLTVELEIGTNGRSQGRSPQSMP